MESSGYIENLGIKLVFWGKMCINFCFAMNKLGLAYVSLFVIDV